MIKNINIGNEKLRMKDCDLVIRKVDTFLTWNPFDFLIIHLSYKIKEMYIDITYKCILQ